MRHLIVFLLCAAAFHATAQKTKKADPFAGLDTQLEQVLKDWKAAGFAVAVVNKDRIVYSKGFGYRNVVQKQPVTTNTLFAIGSVTKAFTASLMGILQKEGKVDFDKPAHNYMPGLGFYNDALNNSVTLRHMMSHQTGLPRHDFSWYLFHTSSRDSILQRVRYQEPTAGIRAKWQYNNFMFAAQGAIAEKLMGRSWEEVVKAQILTPLEMNRTNFSVTDLEKSEDASYGYDLRGDTAIRKMPYHNINSMGPAGSINSNVTEMASWLITWINGGKYKGKEILPASYVSEAMTAQAIVAPGLPDKEKPDVHFATYGFGWSMSSYRGHYRVEHGGNIDGFSASAAFFPTDSIGIVVLTNQDRSSVPSIVRNIISDRMLELKPYNWNSDLKKAADKAKAQQKEAAKSAVAKMAAATRPSHPPGDYAATYYHPGYGNLEVFVKKDSLFARFSEERVLWLRHNNYDVFDPFMVDKEEGIDTAFGKLPIPIQFRLDLGGEVESLTAPFEGGLDPLVFKKQLKAVVISSSDLKKYEGDYTLSGATIKVYTKASVLFVLVPGQPEYELVPQGNEKFALKVVPGYSVQFAQNDKGDVTDMTFVQPNGNFKAVRK